MPVEGPKKLTIREIVDLAEMRALEDMQKEVWGVDDREIFPALAFRPITAVGGVLLGAFVDGRMAGFVFGFPGIEQGRVIFHSDMLAVRPEYRSQGIGYKLKLAQRERTLEKGIDKITWTFDPLQYVNAYLNFARLGVISDRYLVDFYGETSSFLHSTGTDRLWLTWHLNNERVRQRLSAPMTTELANEFEQATVLVRVARNDEPLLTSDETLAGPASIEIPHDINSLSGDLKIRWRETTRQAFVRVLDNGYVVEDFCPIQRDGANIGRYLLRRDEDSLKRTEAGAGGSRQEAGFTSQALPHGLKRKEAGAGGSRQEAGFPSPPSRSGYCPVGGGPWAQSWRASGARALGR